VSSKFLVSPAAPAALAQKAIAGACFFSMQLGDVVSANRGGRKFPGKSAI